MEPWMGQLTLGGAAILLLVLLGKSYINHVANSVSELRSAHREELKRLTDSWEARLSDADRRATSWEAAAHRYESASAEDRAQIGKLLPAVEQSVALLHAIREEQRGT